MRLKNLSWLVAVVLAVGPWVASPAQDPGAPKPPRRAAKKAPVAPAPPAATPAPAPAPAPPPPVPPPAAPPAQPVVVPSKPEADEAPLNRLQRPGDLDVRLHVDTDILLAFVEAGVAADLGLIPAGPGTLAVGGELSGGLCLTACGLIGLITGIDVSDRFLSPHARLTYHFIPPGQKAEKLDIYGLFLAGVTVATQTVSGTIQNVHFEYKGTGVGPSVGLGIGAKMFVKERLFIGGEARLRYARGEYNYSEQVEGFTISGVDPDWSQTGLSLVFFGGIRL